MSTCASSTSEPDRERMLHSAGLLKRTSAWPTVAAVLILVALLAIFRQVLLGAVQQGEARRTAVAAQAEALWQCKSLHGLGARDACLLELKALSSTMVQTAP